ncbi:LysM peptidoglycan-binding domain-containing protein [Tumebacillus sp. DT12]|uniref:LysM peptidoglycan-binding domain-containing protein n=1 Tax=Tumebacillus lacus TaxID=2995335 RepID=A0ABT3X1U0_9BACL|nr:LysM peptidoglycan-binding domain-containing protein [Tumebacillus lacus]MCX7569530.1 LysM peptidoglycan-binding domain-containing protein [Tumebacillus lacus]
MPHPPYILREKWVQTQNGGELHVFLRHLDFLAETGGPLGEEERNERVEITVRRYLADKYAGSSIKTVKVFLGSMLLVTMAGGELGGKTGLGSQTAYAASTMQLYLNGVQCVACTPQMQNGHLIVPVRPVAEGLGGTVSFDSATRQVTVTRGALKMVFTIGSNQAVVGGRTITMEEPLTLIGSTSYVSAEFLARQMGANYVYDTYRSAAVLSMQPSEVYTVQSGDSLWKIATNRGTTVDAIQRLNGMTATAGLYPGEKLLIPAKAMLYTVQPGDSLWLIAARFNVTISAIKTANGLTTDTLTVGKQLTIPASAAPAPTAPTPAPTPTAPAPAPTTVTYTVVAGDSLSVIAARYGTTVTAIRTANNLTSDMIYVGQKLTIPSGTATPTPTPTAPAPAPAAGEYIVQPGDTLSGLAARYNTTVDAIKQASGMTGDSLIAGQRLMIPGYVPPPPPAESYLSGADPTAVAQLGNANFIFPFQSRTGYDPLRDTWGDTRTYNPTTGEYRQHEGTDIMAPSGTPLVSVGSGVITNYGWSELGGWRVTIRLDNTDYSVYYAHMSRYAPGLGKGVRVSKGQLIGYVGATGYGPEGTTGKFAPHLHFGLYDNAAGFAAINPYPFLKYWETRL